MAMTTAERQSRYRKRDSRANRHKPVTYAPQWVYYAKAINPGGKIGQLVVVKTLGKPVSQKWTDKTYRSDLEADRDITALNAAIETGRRNVAR